MRSVEVSLAACEPTADSRLDLRRIIFVASVAGLKPGVFSVAWWAEGERVPAVTLFAAARPPLITRRQTLRD